MSHLAYLQLCDAVYDHALGEVADIGILFKNNTYAFSGSDETKDWIANFISIIPVWYPGLGIVPLGFLMRALRIYKKVYADMKYRNLSPSVVAFTGHSLGGTVAILIAALFKYHFQITLKEIVVAGNPHTGNLQLLNTASIFCYRNGDDHVTEVPRHFPNCRQYIDIGDDSGFQPFSDHSIKGYITAYKLAETYGY